METVQKTPMPERDAVERAGNFQEVNLGLPEELARTEATSCLECKKPKCVDSCPVGIDIPSFVHAVADGRFKEALAKFFQHDLVREVFCQGGGREHHGKQEQA